MTRRGIDVSHWQHPNDEPIDWHKVRRAGFSWAAIKLTEGDHYASPWAARDLAGAKGAGLETVLYHFARPLTSGGRAQARTFLDQVARLGGADGAALDVEDGRQMGWGRLAGWVDEYLNAGAAQFVYYDRDYRRHLRPFLHLGFAREWVAAPTVAAVGSDVAVVQVGQMAVPGVPARCDVDLVHYDR